jgi:hypothetical protein
MPITNLYDKIISEKGGFEKLIAKIPGFRGYQEMQARRNADTLLRRYLGDRMEQVVKRFTRLESNILGNGSGLKHMTRTREVKSKLQAYTDVINTANPKYSGMWDSVKIDAEALERIYSFDEAQVRYIDDLEGKIGALGDALKGDDFSQELETIYDTAVEAIDAFALRDNEILQLDSELGSTHTHDDKKPAAKPQKQPQKEDTSNDEEIDPSQGPERYR